MGWVTLLAPDGLCAAISDKLWIGGALIVALVALQCALAAADSLWRLAHAGAQRAREARLLEFRLAAARKRRDAEQKQALAWNGWRKFTVAMRVQESRDVCSFYLKPHDGKPLPSFKPGQYLTFRLDVPGQSRPVIRCYSLSDCLHDDYFRVSIRRVASQENNSPPGVASCFFHDQLREGEIIDIKAPSGSFFLDLETTHPIVLLAGGIGITPLLSMLNALVKDGPLTRTVHFFYSVANSAEHSFAQHLSQLARQQEKLHLHVCYSRPHERDAQGTDYDTKGRLTVELLKKVLPSNNFQYYLCGPPGLMESLITDLKAWGVPEAHVHSEAFGASTVTAIATATGAIHPPAAADAAASKIAVEFARSGRKETWTPGDGTLLEFAERHQVPIASGCRAGNCGTCMVAIRKGNVSYQAEPGFEVESGSCLTCCCVPQNELVIDA